MKTALTFIAFIVIAFAASAIGAAFPPGAWYESLRKPPLNPPNWIFGPVWTLLYIGMGVAAALVWRTSHSALPIGLWAAQLILNAAWSWLFFGLHRPGLAFAEILVLWACILATTVVFWRVRPLAGALLLPYLAWVGFAGWLNWGLWRLNG
jgi:tryptophan-rich sensory protein